jgi:hypothetical protein
MWESPVKSINVVFLGALVLAGMDSTFASGQPESAQLIGKTPQGDRRIVPVVGGSFSGPQLKGQVLAGGGDWTLFRKDGAAQLDVRATLRTDDGVLIYVSYRGVSIIPPEVRQRIMGGEDVDPAMYYFPTTPYFETASEKYSWLNKLVTVGIGKRTATSVIYSIYAIK